MATMTIILELVLFFIARAVYKRAKQQNNTPPTEGHQAFNGKAFRNTIICQVVIISIAALIIAVSNPLDLSLVDLAKQKEIDLVLGLFVNALVVVMWLALGILAVMLSAVITLHTMIITVLIFSGVSIKKGIPLPKYMMTFLQISTYAPIVLLALKAYAIIHLALVAI